MCAALITFAVSRFGERVLHNRFTAYIGGISMEIYLSHMMIFRGIEKIGLNTRFGNGAAQYVITTISVFAGTVIFASVYRFCERFVRKSYRNILTRRNS